MNNKVEQLHGVTALHLLKPTGILFWGFGSFLSNNFHFSGLKIHIHLKSGSYRRMPISLRGFALGSSCMNITRCSAGNRSCSHVCCAYFCKWKNIMSQFIALTTHFVLLQLNMQRYRDYLCGCVGFFPLA